MSTTVEIVDFHAGELKFFHVHTARLWCKAFYPQLILHNKPAGNMRLTTTGVKNFIIPTGYCGAVTITCKYFAGSHAKGKYRLSVKYSRSPSIQ